jgi:hypothetical protein
MERIYTSLSGVVGLGVIRQGVLFEENSSLKPGDVTTQGMQQAEAKRLSNPIARSLQRIQIHQQFAAKLEATTGSDNLRARARYISAIIRW